MTPFSGIAGHEIPKRFFANFLADPSRMPHALLLTGPEGVGKFAMAYQFARAMNCLCEKMTGCCCLHCSNIGQGTFSDVMISSSHDELKAADIRRLVGEVTISPRVARHRLVILDSFDRVNETAANIFLKTLEEPPEYLKFILITSRPGSLLPTIRSRCVPLDFKPISIDETAAALRGLFVDIPDEMIRELSSTGRFGEAAREIYADMLQSKKKPGKKAEAPYHQLLDLFIDGVLMLKPGIFGFHLKEYLGTLQDSVEGRWELRTALPSGLDIPGLKRYLSGEMDRFVPVNYLISEGKTGKLKEYDKVRVLTSDILRVLYSRVRQARGQTAGADMRLLKLLDITREIRKDLDGNRNIELSFEKLLIGVGV